MYVLLFCTVTLLMNLSNCKSYFLANTNPILIFEILSFSIVITSVAATLDCVPLIFIVFVIMRIQTIWF